MMFHAIQKKDVAFPSAITISSEAKDLISRVVSLFHVASHQRPFEAYRVSTRFGGDQAASVVQGHELGAALDKGD
jgi:hypothetical protein